MHRPGWGLHRLGYLSARAPWLALTLVIGLSALAVYGISLIHTPPHSLNALFQSTTPEYRRYEAMREAFPLNERDILAVVEASQPFRPADIETMRDFHLELQLLEQSEGVLSLFSVRGEPGADGYAPPIVPDFLPEGEAFEALMDEVVEHPFVAGKFLNTKPEGGQSLVIVVGMAEEAVSPANLESTLTSVTGAAENLLRGTDLNYELFGVPVMQLEVRYASRSDRLTFNIVGFLVGILMCLLFFRNGKLVLISTLCPAISVLWSFGAMGVAGIPLSFFLNAIPPLVMVISFADAMHLTYGIRRRMRDGDTVAAAVHRTVRTVGPACLLTTMTTSIALTSLLISDATVIRDFGVGGALSVMLVFFVSMLVVPSLSMLVLRDAGSTSARTAPWATDAGLDGVSAKLALWVPRFPLALTAIGLAASLVFAVLHFSLEPRFRLSEQVPDSMRERILATKQAGGFAAASPVYVVIGYPEEERPTSSRLRSLVGSVHDVLSRHETMGSVWSLALIDRELAAEGGGDLSEYLEELPENLRARLVNEEAHLLLVTGHFPDLNATEMRAAIDEIEAALEPLRAAYPDVSIQMTGATVVSALHATTMIQDLNRSLLMAILIVMALLAVAFYSLSVPMVAFLPNLFPIVASGALLYVVGFGIDYAGIIALTVAFGLAVDDTIHFIARFQHERTEGSDTLEAVMVAIRRIGPVMVITTVVLVCGVGVTIFGQMPQTRTFGGIVVMTLLSALVADLIFLPALILTLEKVARALRIV
jgi:hypothetical protein